jgi:hypothetical protein
LTSQSLLVLMPESSPLRTHAPAGAELRLRGALAEGGFNFSILDFRAALPDSVFYDYAHLNASGGKRFSRDLAASLGRQISCQKEAPNLALDLD